MYVFCEIWLQRLEFELEDQSVGGRGILTLSSCAVFLLKILPLHHLSLHNGEKTMVSLYFLIQGEKYHRG